MKGFFSESLGQKHGHVLHMAKHSTRQGPDFTLNTHTILLAIESSSNYITFIAFLQKHNIHIKPLKAHHNAHGNTFHVHEKDFRHYKIHRVPYRCHSDDAALTQPVTSGAGALQS